MIRTTALILALAAGGVASCQRAEDPAQAGFVDGILNELDGTYDARLKAKQRERQGLEAANAALSEQVAALRSQETANARRIGASERQLNETQDRIAALKRRYAAEEDRYRAELATLEEVEVALDKQRAQLIMVSDSDADEDHVLEATRRVQELSRIVDLMPE